MVDMENLVSEKKTSPISSNLQKSTDSINSLWKQYDNFFYLDLYLACLKVKIVLWAQNFTW